MEFQRALEYFGLRGLEPRPGQVEVLKTLAAGWKDHRYFAINAPTGTGKSHVALAVSHACTDSYVVTSTKLLQKQYKDIDRKVKEIKGRANYPCSLVPSLNCESGPCSTFPKLKRECIGSGICVYYNKLREAIQAHVFLTNYQYFLYANHCGPLKPANLVPPRNVLIMDEAHDLEGNILSFAELLVAPAFLHEEFGVKGMENVQFTGKVASDFKILVAAAEQIGRRLSDFKGKIDKLYSKVGGDYRNVDELTAEKVSVHQKKSYELDKVLQRVKIYLNSMTSSENRKFWMNHHDSQANTLLISPLTSKFHFEYFLRHTADKFVFMSATLDGKDRLCREFGIDPSEMLYVDVPSQFDHELSPVVHIPVGKMNSREIETSLPEIVKACRRILQEHEGEKGLIHTTSYKVAQHIFDNLRDRRILYARGDSMKVVTNEGILQRHRQSRDGVLLSPSMMTGIDLDEDEGRFQIICKLPFESLGNPRTARKTELDPEWYDLEMLKKCMQSCGRTTRSAEDSSVSYVLDSSFSYYFKKYRDKLPMWFQERVIL